MKVSNTLAVILFSTAAASANSATTSTTTTTTLTSMSEAGNYHIPPQSIIVSRVDSLHSMENGSFHPQSSDQWLGPLTNLKTFRHDVGARVVVRPPRLQARNEGVLGQAPWYGMAIGLACTTLAAVMLG